jgi:hypothetical protein
MAVKRYDTIGKIVRAWEGGEMSRLYAMARTMAIVTPRNVDRVMEALPEPVRARFIEWTRGLVAPKGRIVRLMRGERIPEHPRAREAMRGWLVRNGWIARDQAA